MTDTPFPESVCTLLREHLTTFERHGVSNHKTVLKALRQREGAAARAAFEKDIKDGNQRLKVAVANFERSGDEGKRPTFVLS